ncbi:hypothetical protein B0O99DRAFT_175277 [Bisporella sp. PMI_857]|nr:hypothetical protein B0O99DRAFT_175277 [Bisporella sp. PMI_857]
MLKVGEAAEFGQQRYDQHLQSTENAKLHLILEAINAKRATKGLAEWNIITATELVREMAASTRIHYDGRGMVARIPPDGHPENKYVVSEAEAGNTPYITENKKSHEFEVTYDSSRAKGPPILQPNKYEYYQRIAFKVGSEIGDLLVDMSEPYDTSDRFLKQKRASQRAHQIMDASTKRNKPSLQSIALELHERAPDLAAEVPLILAQIKNDPKSLSDADAATLIQMELIQEANNNWESRFPETEHVWDFAAARLAKSIKTHGGADVRVPPRQYFDMRRWPLSCQSTETQIRIRSGGLKMEEPPAETMAEEAEQDLDDVVQRQNILDRKPPVERHTGRGQVPFFPFGETLYQRSFMSFRMDKELEDVEDFNPKPPRDRWSKFKRNFLPSSRGRLTGSTALPEVKGWVPDSISREEKRIDLAERQMKTPGYPDEEEFYFNSSEIEKRRQREKFHSAQKRQFEAQKKVVDWYREREGWNFGALQYDDLTDQEKRTAWSALDIDPLRQVVRTPPSSHGGPAQPPTTPLGDSGGFARSATTPPRAPRKRRRTSSHSRL